MSRYESFASIYDMILEDFPYDRWRDYILAIFEKYKLEPEIILDIGCGTGEMTTRLAKKGYTMIGLDLSEDMLAVAREKATNSQLDIIYTHQDMTDFELYGSVNAVISTCDSLNYILEEEDLLGVFTRIAYYLEPGGLFIFDMNTAYKFKELLGSHTYAENYEDFSYIWENYYDEEEKINEYFLTIFTKEEDHFTKHIETHYEKEYSINAVKKLLDKAGLILEGVYHDGTFGEPHEQTDRIHFIATKK